MKETFNWPRQDFHFSCSHSTSDQGNRQDRQNHIDRGTIERRVHICVPLPVQVHRAGDSHQEFPLLQSTLFCWNQGLSSNLGLIISARPAAGEPQGPSSLCSPALVYKHVCCHAHISFGCWDSESKFFWLAQQTLYPLNCLSSFIRPTEASVVFKQRAVHLKAPCPW